MIRFLSRERISFEWIALDQMRVNKAAMGVYGLLHEVPYGATVTHAALAKMASSAGYAVRGPMHGRQSLVVHHAVSAHSHTNGLGGFSTRDGLDTKRALRALEDRVTIAGQFTLPGK